jgi:hypothetical protein
LRDEGWTVIRNQAQAKDDKEGTSPKRAQTPEVVATDTASLFSGLGGASSSSSSGGSIWDSLGTGATDNGSGDDGTDDLLAMLEARDSALHTTTTTAATTAAAAPSVKKGGSAHSSGSNGSEIIVGLEWRPALAVEDQEDFYNSNSNSNTGGGDDDDDDDDNDDDVAMECGAASDSQVQALLSRYVFCSMFFLLSLLDVSLSLSYPSIGACLQALTPHDV